MALKRIKIFTNLEKVNEEQDPRFEVEQKLTIASNGAVSFVSSTYGGGYNQYAKGRRLELKIEPETAKEILDRVEAYFSEQITYNIVAGFGFWNLTVTDDKRAMHDYYGSTTGVYHELTKFIQDRIPINHLSIFDQ